MFPKNLNVCVYVWVLILSILIKKLYIINVYINMVINVYINMISNE